MRKNRTKTLIGILLAVCLVVGLMPTAAFAAGKDTGKAIQLGIGGITGYSDTNSYDYIYFGDWTASDSKTPSGPIKWRVLDDQTNTEGTGLFLLSDVLLGTSTDGGVQFENTDIGNGSNKWQGSNAQSWCNSFYNSNLTQQEQGAVLPTTKSDEEYTTTSAGFSLKFTASGNILNSDRVFFLSAAEVENEAYGFTDNAARYANYGNSTGYWWLRSPMADFDIYVGLVSSLDGSVGYNSANDTSAARPAFNLNLNSVLFTSAAADDKSADDKSAGGKSANGLDSGLATVDTAGTHWKLTLKDDSRNSFTASTNSDTTKDKGYSGWTVDISYSGAQTGGNEYVSAMLVDSSDTVLYYGRIANNSASGTASVTIPSDLAAGSYTLKVFSEQYNGDNMTDYASAFWEIALEVVSPQYTVTFGTDYGTAPAPMTVTEDTLITLPELEDDGDHVFVCWQIIDSFDAGFYPAGEEYRVKGDVTFVAVWDEIVTLTAPFTTTVELRGKGVPGETVFTLEVVSVNVPEEFDEDIYKDVTVSASVTTNGQGDYDATMTFTGLCMQLRDMLTMGVYVQQVDDGIANWTYDDAVWYLILASDPEISALASTYDVLPEDPAPEYKVLIFQAIREETEDGPVYGLDENMDWDAPEAKMRFTNIYTTSTPTPGTGGGTPVPTPTPTPVSTPVPTSTPGTGGGNVSAGSDVGSGDNPQTGDSSRVGLHIGLMMAGIAGIGCSALMYRRRKS